MSDWIVWTLFAAGLGILWFVNRMAKRLDDDDDTPVFNDEGYEKARTIVHNDMLEETMTIEKAVTSEDPEQALADRLNTKGGPLG